QRLRQYETLLKSERKLLDEVRTSRPETGALERTFDGGAPARSAEMECVGKEIEELLDAHVLVDARHVRDVSDERAHSRGIGDHVVTRDRHASTVGVRERRQHLDERGLPCPVRPDEAEDFTSLDPGTESIERRGG